MLPLRHFFRFSSYVADGCDFTARLCGRSEDDARGDGFDFAFGSATAVGEAIVVRCRLRFGANVLLLFGGCDFVSRLSCS